MHGHVLHRDLELHGRRPSFTPLPRFYARDGGEIHLRDVLGIIRVSGPDLDEPYVVEWADRLGVRA